MDTTFELTNEELITIKKFVTMINYHGIKETLKFHVSRSYGDTEIQERLLDDAITALNDFCGYDDGVAGINAPQAVYQAAPQLALVTLIAKTAPHASLVKIPEDFIPSDKLVQKCLAEYYEGIRRMAGTSLCKDKH